MTEVKMQVETKVVSGGIKLTSLPSCYIRPESERPKLSEVSDSEDLPVIDLGSGDRSLIVSQIGEACRIYGIFQIINHGVAHQVLDEMLEVSMEFFNLPVEEKLKLYSEDSTKYTRFATRLNYAKETVHNWRDYLRLHCYPNLEKNVAEWPSNPLSFKEIASRYCKEVSEVNFKLLEAISESLGLVDKDSINNALGEQGQQPMVINYYPPCPQPELTYALPSHTDHNTLTILLPDSETPGLQFFKDGKWIPIKPRLHAFVVNVGDQLQVLSNGSYKSVSHRVIANNSKARISVASFLSPSFDAILSAPKAIMEEGSPAIYRDFIYSEFFNAFWNSTVDSGSCLDLFKN